MITHMHCSRYPLLIQMNTRVWLSELSSKLKKAVTLFDIPDNELDDLKSKGFDWVWMLSVWQTGTAGKKVSQSNPQWLMEFKQTLPDLSNKDIAGSGFAVKSYTVHEDIGGDKALANLRDRLRARGIKLMLDFVPNHTALDHCWVENKPEYYISATESELQREPRNYTLIKRGKIDLILAHGRDPNFEGWPDTLQLNYGNPELRKAMICELLSISEKCDGLRCDMAMLLVPEVFNRTWNIPTKPFWTDVIGKVKKKIPAFCFMAEVYWDMEWELMQQGFDYAYDKRLYDRLHNGTAELVREHLKAGMDYQSRLARFIENHDEQRASVVFPAEKYEASAVISYMSPGLHLFHQGQLQGKKIRISPHLNRGPDEPPNEKIKSFYENFLNILGKTPVNNGQWQLLECSPAWESNWTWDCFVSFAWKGIGNELAIVSVNFAPNSSQCYIRLPFLELIGKNWVLKDHLHEITYERSGDDLFSRGLFMDMSPWRCCVFFIRSL